MSMNKLIPGFIESPEYLVVVLKYELPQVIRGLANLNTVILNTKNTWFHASMVSNEY